jgi:hypothetical protein
MRPGLPPAVIFGEFERDLGVTWWLEKAHEARDEIRP